VFTVFSIKKILNSHCTNYWLRGLLISEDSCCNTKVNGGMQGR